MTRRSAIPLPTPMAMSAAPLEASPSPTSPAANVKIGKAEAETPKEQAAGSLFECPAFPKPKVRLECRSLDHEGANVFFSNINVAHILSNAISIVLSTLYSPSRTNAHIPSTRSVTLVLRSMEGVAYTTGIELDGDHKEIHLSLDYLKAISDHGPGKEGREIEGVLVHEMVHCWQWNGKGTAPEGLIEGIADYVRLRAALDPPHWKKEAGGQWDAGYQHTGYFLNWIEESIGQGSVRRINDALKENRYEDSLWHLLFDKSIAELWSEYQETLEA